VICTGGSSSRRWITVTSHPPTRPTSVPPIPAVTNRAPASTIENEPVTTAAILVVGAVVLTCAGASTARAQDRGYQGVFEGSGNDSARKTFGASLAVAGGYDHLSVPGIGALEDQFQLPGFFATPNSHGLGISKGSKHPELAWEFLKMVTSEDWTSKLSERRKVLTGNIASDKKLLDQLGKDDPLAAAVLQTQVEDTNKLTGNWPLANDARVKEAFYPEIQNAVLGRKPAAQALKDAEAKVDRVLGQ